MNREVHLLLKARNAAITSGDAQAYSASRTDLRRGIKRAMRSYKLRIEAHFSTSDPWRMWQGIQTISNYKPTNSVPSFTNISFLNELNDFYACFECDTQETAVIIKPLENFQPWKSVML